MSQVIGEPLRRHWAPADDRRVNRTRSPTQRGGLDYLPGGAALPEPEIVAFGVDQVKRLTGLSSKQLRYWEQTGFFVPDYASPERATRIYSFRDLVGLYTVARLRKDYRFSLQELRPIGEYLHRYHDTPW